MRTIGFDAGRSENSHARAHKMQNPKSSQEIANYAQESNELVETRPRTFEKNLVGALWRHCQGGTCRVACFENWSFWRVHRKMRRLRSD